MSLRSFILGALLSIAAVLAIQPVYFAAMANLDRVISHDAIRQHIRDAFQAGVLSDDNHPSNHLFTSGDRFTDCIALSVGMQPGATPLAEGILAPSPSSDRHPCADLRIIGEGQPALQWYEYLRYWHGYRLYYAPLASMLPIYAVKLTNLVLLLLASAAFLWQSNKLVGSAPTISLAAPVLFLTDFIRVWHVTPHALGVIYILAATSCYAAALRRAWPNYTLMVLAAAFGSIFNFIDFLVNPPWMPMLLAFFTLYALRERKGAAATAAVVALAWFGGYGLTWFSKWFIASFFSATLNVAFNVWTFIVFRMDGDDAKVTHWLFAATAKVVAAAIVGWGLPLYLVFAWLWLKNLRSGDFRWNAFWPLAWPALIPVLWFEIMSSHSQIHARVTSRSEAAAIGVLIAAAFLATGVKTFAVFRAPAKQVAAADERRAFEAG
jgi:hypothetical protein